MSGKKAASDLRDDDNDHEVDDMKDKSKEAQEQSKDLQKLNQESAGPELDEKKAGAAVHGLLGQSTKKAGEKELLPKITLNKEDVDIFRTELDVGKDVAEYYLRRNHGNLVKALEEAVRDARLKTL